MLALVRKDLVVLVLVVVGAVACSISNLDPERVFLWPGDRSLEDFALGWLLGGALLGLYLGGFDYVARTGEYLLHRSLGRSTIVLTWLATGFVVGALIVTLPLLYCALELTWAWEHNLSDPYRRLPEYLGLGLTFWTGFSAVFYGITVRGSVWRRLAIVVLSFSGVLMAFIASITPWGTRSLQASLSLHVALHVSLTVAFAWGAWAEFVTGDDRDRVMPTRRLVPSSVAFALAATIAAVVGLSGIQSEAHRMLTWKEFPFVLEEANGELNLWRDVTENGVRKRVRVDEYHAPTAEPRSEGGNRRRIRLQDAIVVDDLRWLSRRNTYQSVLFDGVWELWDGNYSHGNLYFRPSDGRGFVADSERHRDRPSRFDWTRVRRGENDEPFSAETLVLGPQNDHYGRRRSGWHQKSLVADLEDGSIWFSANYYREQPRYERLRLPGDDRPKSSGVSARNEILVRGERGTYRWTGDGFEAVDDEPAAFLDVPTVEDGVRLLAADPIAPLIEVDGADGSKFTHRYGLYTGSERLLGSVLFGATALRSPLLSLWTFVSDRRADAMSFPEHSVGWETDPSTVLLDPLIAAGKRPWLLGVGCLLSLLFGALAARRLRRLGGSAGRAAFWFVLTLLAGPLVYLIYRNIETRRAWRPATIVPAAEQKPLLIRSA